MPYCVEFHIGTVLIEMHRGWDEPHTPCCFVLPLSDELSKLNQQHDIYQRFGTSCFLDQVSLCTTGHCAYVGACACRCSLITKDIGISSS